MTTPRILTPRILTPRILTAALAATVAGAALTGCTTEDSAQTAPDTAAESQVTVNATDTECALSTTEAGTGSTTFAVTNNGTKVTEFYVYGSDDRVLAEVENISPGLQREVVVAFNDAGAYTVACKPGMVGDGIRTDFTVNGSSVTTQNSGAYQKASDGYKAYVVGQADELVNLTSRFVAAIKAGDVEGAKLQYPIARTPWERIQTVAESFPDDLDPRIDLREADRKPGHTWTGFHRLEKDLWVSGPQLDTTAIADQLLADVIELRAQVSAPEFRVDATQIASGAQDLLDEVANSKITGEEDIFSLTDLWDFHANVEGSQAAIAAVRPLLDQQHAELGKRIDERFAEVNGLLEKYRRGDGYVAYISVTEPERQELSRALDALSKEVSQVRGVIAAK